MSQTNQNTHNRDKIHRRVLSTEATAHSMVFIQNDAESRQMLLHSSVEASTTVHHTHLENVRQYFPIGHVCFVLKI